MEPKTSDSNKPRIVVQYDDHPTFMASGLCSLVAHQSLVDVAIRCGNQTLQAHKVILAANSPFFREQLESNPDTEQIITTGIDYVAMKNIIEFIYCGETTILEKNLKYVVAAAKLFEIRGLQAIGSESPDGDEMLFVAPPLFINQKPKYSSAYPFTQIPKPKLPEGNLEYGINNQDEYISDLNTVPLQVMNYTDINESMIPLDNKEMNLYEIGNIPEPSERPLYADDIGRENIDIMYKTPSGQYVQVSNDIFHTMTADDMPYEGDMPLTSTSTTDLQGMDLSQKLQPNYSENTLGDFHDEPYDDQLDNDDDQQDQEDDTDDQENQDGDDGHHAAQHDVVDEHVDSYNDPYYAEENYRDLEGVSPNMKDDLNMLLHFQSHGRDFAREMEQLSNIGTLEELGELHTLDPLPRVIAETISDNQGEDMASINESKAEEYLGDEEDPLRDDEEEDNCCEDDNQNGLLQQFNTIPYYESMRYDDGNPLKAEDDYDQEQADSE